MTRFATPFFLTALLCLAVPGADAAEKLIADYGGHAGFQSATWVGRDLRIFEKHGLDVEIVMITGAARSVAALLGNSTHFSTGSATGPLGVAWHSARITSPGLSARSASVVRPLATWVAVVVWMLTRRSDMPTPVIRASDPALSCTASIVPWYT